MFDDTNLLSTVLDVIQILLAILVPLCGFLYYIFILRPYRASRKYFQFIWKKNSHLIPNDILDERAEERYGYKNYYHKRKIDNSIVKAIESGKNILITGNPLSGKTRAVYRALIHVNRPYYITRPYVLTIDPNDFHVPKMLQFWRCGKRRILLLDDIDDYLRDQTFQHQFRSFMKEKVLIIATCREGVNIKAVGDYEIKSLFHVINIEKIKPDVANKVALEAKVFITEMFDGNIGSLFMPLEAMAKRFRELEKTQKYVLYTLKRLYAAGIYKEKATFPNHWVRKAVEGKYSLKLIDSDWETLLDYLSVNGFFDRAEDSVKLESAYFSYVIEDRISLLENFKEMLSIFSDEPEALFNLGTMAGQMGQVTIEKAKLEKIAIAALTSASFVSDSRINPVRYAMIQNNLGNSYWMLAGVEGQAENCRKSIAAYEAALNIYTIEHFPMEYATTKNNLGNAYVTLAEVSEKADNCRKAIEAYNKALKVRTSDRFPLDYATTQINLGTAYGTLAQIEDEADNCREAIKACEEALNVHTRDRSPMLYAAAQNNLGAAYRRLALVEYKADNCRKAIAAYEEALNIYTIERFPMDYATTKNNLGTAYGTLAQVEEKADNSKRAIAARRVALKVHTLKYFPIDYAATQSDLSIDYQTLAEAEDAPVNLRRAREALKEAIKGFKKAGLLQQVEEIEKSLRELQQ